MSWTAPCPSAAPSGLTIALLPFGFLIEDFLDTIKVSLEAVLHRDDRRLAFRLHGSAAPRGCAVGVDLLFRARDGACAVSSQTKRDDGLGAAVSAGLSGDETENSKSRTRVTLKRPVARWPACVG